MGEHVVDGVVDRERHDRSDDRQRGGATPWRCGTGERRTCAGPSRASPPGAGHGAATSGDPTPRPARRIVDGVHRRLTAGPPGGHHRDEHDDGDDRQRHGNDPWRVELDTSAADDPQRADTKVWRDERTGQPSDDRTDDGDADQLEHLRGHQLPRRGAQGVAQPRAAAVRRGTGDRAGGDDEAAGDDGEGAEGLQEAGEEVRVGEQVAACVVPRVGAEAIATDDVGQPALRPRRRAPGAVSRTLIVAPVAGPRRARPPVVVHVRPGSQFG